MIAVDIERLILSAKVKKLHQTQEFNDFQPEFFLMRFRLISRYCSRAK